MPAARSVWKRAYGVQWLTGCPLTLEGRWNARDERMHSSEPSRQRATVYSVRYYEKMIDRNGADCKMLKRIPILLTLTEKGLKRSTQVAKRWLARVICTPRDTWKKRLRPKQQEGEGKCEAASMLSVPNSSAFINRSSSDWNKTERRKVCGRLTVDLCSIFSHVT